METALEMMLLIISATGRPVTTFCDFLLKQIEKQ